MLLKNILEALELKRKLVIFFSILIFLLSLCQIALAASVTPITYPGNDAQDKDKLTPAGCVYYLIEGSDKEGTYTLKFDENGNLDPNGCIEIKVVVGKKNGNSYTEVLSWESNIPIYAVIVKGGPAYNFYKYPSNVKSDTNLTAPIVSSGKPADVSHVSVIFCPSECPKPPTPPVNPCDCFIIKILVLVAFLLSLINILVLNICFVKCCCKKSCNCNDC